MRVSIKKSIKSRKSTTFARRQKPSKKILKKDKKILKRGKKRLSYIEERYEFDQMTNRELFSNAGFFQPYLADAVEYTGLSYRQLLRLYAGECELHPSTKKLLILKVIGGIPHEKWRGWFVCRRDGHLYNTRGVYYSQEMIESHDRLYDKAMTAERELYALNQEIQKGLYAARTENKNRLVELANEILEITGEAKSKVRRSA